MHTYRKAKGGWQAGYQHPDEEFSALGPICDFEWEAAAYASFLNGGRYCPDEIEPIFPKEYPPVEADDSIHPDRPDFDYAVERRK